ncbi:MAG: 50S ribosomal protein L24e [Methanobacteriota archaeon]|nr:MAG: 50S ribosomal protein L24e [Euryarchaeota archaeon]
MVECSFCAEEITRGKGLIYAKADGTINYFCSSKCRNNSLNLGRVGRRKKWTKAFKDFRSQQARKKK